MLKSLPTKILLRITLSINMCQQKLPILYGAILLGIAFAIAPVPKALAQKNPAWEFLQGAVPPSLLERIRQDYAKDINPEQPVNVGLMQVWQIRSKRAKPLYLVNTRLPGLDTASNPSCGQAGCLFYGYTTSGKGFIRVLNGYINDFQVEDAPPIIQATSQVTNQLPCLQLNFYQEQKLLTSKLCFDGKEYQPVQAPTVLP